MKIAIQNLGAIKQAEFELGDFTIICGGNNTGKTYATYALFGFLYFWKQAFSIKVPDSIVHSLLSEGTVEIDLNRYKKDINSIILSGCKNYDDILPRVFASSEKKFEKSHFLIALDTSLIEPLKSYNRTMRSDKTQLFLIEKKADSDTLSISLLTEKENIKIPQHIIKDIISDALKDVLFSKILPRPFIASAERTGAAIFRNELNFARNRLLDEMGAKNKEINPIELLSKVYTDYPLPVKSNVDFTRQLEDVAKKDSFIKKDYPEILEKFADIIGGSFLVTRSDELYYVPKGKTIKLTMDESSSSVRSLLDIGFYLRHVAMPGDLLMVDEPELNLHPENQRRMARLFAQLVTIGIKVFITTHSDYIIKELNTLIMLNGCSDRLSKIAQQEGYSQKELLDPKKIRVYIAEEAPVILDGKRCKTKCQTLVPADIDEKLGIEARSFDKTIEDMNRIQEEIVWGGDE